MPTFDSPVTTSDQSIDRVLGQTLPVVLYLFDQPNRALDELLAQVAREHAGELLVTRVNVHDNPQTYQRFGRPALPALVTLDEGDVESRASAIQPADLEAHVDFLLGQGPQPLETTAQASARAQSGAAPVHVQERTFDDVVLKSSVPVLVDFWAPWCGPCHMVAPTLDQMAQEYAGRLKVAKVNVDDNPMLARKYQAMSIPLLVLFQNGKPVGRLVGAHPRENIERLVAQAL